MAVRFLFYHTTSEKEARRAEDTEPSTKKESTAPTLVQKSAAPRTRKSKKSSSRSQSCQRRFCPCPYTASGRGLALEAPLPSFLLSGDTSKGHLPGHHLLFPDTVMRHFRKEAPKARDPSLACIKQPKQKVRSSNPSSIAAFVSGMGCWPTRAASQMGQRIMRVRRIPGGQGTAGSRACA